MTLFIKTPRDKVFEISEVYVMALTFIIFYSLGRISRELIKKQIESYNRNKKNYNRNKTIKIANPRGGTDIIEIRVPNNNEKLRDLVLSCISNNERYSIKSEKITKLIYKLLGSEFKDETIAITPNLIRYVATALIKINMNERWYIKFVDFIAAFDNKMRAVYRIGGSAAIAGFVGFFSTSIRYGIIALIIHYQATENCGYRCSDYFEHISKDEPFFVSLDESSNKIIIASEKDSKQLELYIPSKEGAKITVGDKKGSIKISKDYVKRKKKAKQVNFSDFVRENQLLSSTVEDDRDEPLTPQKRCLGANTRDSIREAIIECGME